MVHRQRLSVPYAGVLDMIPSQGTRGFPCGSAGKESACNVENLGWSPGWEDPLEKGKATHSSYSGLENSMDCIVHGVVKSQTQLRNFHFHFQGTRSHRPQLRVCMPQRRLKIPRVVTKTQCSQKINIKKKVQVDWSDVQFKTKKVKW